MTFSFVNFQIFMFLQVLPFSFGKKSHFSDGISGSNAEVSIPYNSIFDCKDYIDFR